MQVFAITLFAWMGASFHNHSFETAFFALFAFVLAWQGSKKTSEHFLNSTHPPFFSKKTMAIFFIMMAWTMPFPKNQFKNSSEFKEWTPIYADILTQQTWIGRDQRIHVSARFRHIKDLENRSYLDFENTTCYFVLPKEATWQEAWQNHRWSGQFKLGSLKKIRFKPSHPIGPFLGDEPYPLVVFLKEKASALHQQWLYQIQSLQKAAGFQTSMQGQNLMASMLGAGSASVRVDFLLGRFGLKHLTAISGLHFSIVMLALLALFVKMSVPIRLGLATLGTTLFLVATGFCASSARAWFMALISCYCLWQGRTYEALHALCLSALFWIFLFPEWTLQPGFILSYLCTFLLLLLAQWEKLHPSRHFSEKIISALGWQTLIFLATAPLILFWFHSLTWLAIPANLLIAPLLAFSFFIAFCSCLFFWLPPLSLFLWKISTSFTQLILDTLDNLSLGLDQTFYYSLSTFELSFFMALVGGFLLFFSNQTFSPNTQEANHKQS